jgi:2,4-dienoyl-CoA reductase-like NADH-dependent reductase (Old Yellow Enzyme family)
MAGMESSATAFRAEIEAFLARERVPASTFGRAAVGDPNFVRQLREGRAPSLRLVDRARAYMAGRRRAAGEPAPSPETR